MHEEFIGLYIANTIVACLQDIMLRLNLQLSCCQGQCYDSASDMTGCKSGVILKQEPTVKYLGSIIDTVYELTNSCNTLLNFYLCLKTSKQRF